MRVFLTRNKKIVITLLANRDFAEAYLHGNSHGSIVNIEKDFNTEIKKAFDESNCGKIGAIAFVRSEILIDGDYWNFIKDYYYRHDIEFDFYNGKIALVTAKKFVEHYLNLK